ncbi:hypothetical protein GOP47_0015063, partial [Adiantum capillus-veneris]
GKEAGISSKTCCQARSLSDLSLSHTQTHTHTHTRTGREKRMTDLVGLLRESATHDLRAFEELKADYEQELSRTRGDAYQVASMFVLFQGVIFTAVSQSRLLTCALSWSPVSLSLAASLAAFLAIAHKLYAIGDLQQDIKSTALAMSSLVQQLDSIYGHDDQLAPAALEPPPLCFRRIKFAGLRSILSRDGICAIFLLASFTFLVTSFSVKTLCRHACPRCDV